MSKKPCCAKPIKGPKGDPGDPPIWGNITGDVADQTDLYEVFAEVTDLNDALVQVSGSITDAIAQEVLDRDAAIVTSMADTFPVSSEVDMLALAAKQGDVAIRSDESKSYILRVEPATILGNWSELVSPGGGGITSIPTGNMLWVDVLGDDDTGTPGRFDLPFQTLNAAKAAWTSGYQIHVRPGTYDERVMIGACWWHFEAGAILDYTGTSTGNAFGDDFATPATGRVTGHGIFRHSGTPDLENPTDGAGPYNGAVGFINSSTNTYFECLNVEGRQGANVGTGGLCFDSGIIDINITGELSSTIYDAFLAGGESVGDAVVRGFIRRIYSTADADNAIESAGNNIDVTIEEVVHENADVNSLNIISGNPVFRIGKITGGGVRLQTGKIIGAMITMSDTSDDSFGETLTIGSAASLINCNLIQTKAGVAAINTEGGEILYTKVTSGAGATNSIIAAGTYTIQSRGSTIDAPLGTGVTAEGDLFYDDGTSPSGKVAMGNADGSWSWASLL